jgi:HSP20 family protein
VLDCRLPTPDSPEGARHVQPLGSFDNQFTSLRDAMGRLFDQSFTFGNRGEPADAAAGAQTVPVNVFESEDVLMIIVPMPGLQEEDIDITVRGNSLAIEGQARGPQTGSASAISATVALSPYRRMIELPYAVDANSAEATFNNGVLTVRLQKPRRSASAASRSRPARAARAAGTRRSSSRNNWVMRHA